MKLDYIATIDVDATIDGLINDWNRGKRERVIKALSFDHPGLAAIFISRGIPMKSLISREDCIEIAHEISSKRDEIIVNY